MPSQILTNKNRLKRLSDWSLIFINSLIRKKGYTKFFKNANFKFFTFLSVSDYDRVMISFLIFN